MSQLMSRNNPKLEQFYTHELKPVLRDLEDLRIKTRNWAIASALLLLAVSFGLIQLLGNTLGVVAFFGIPILAVVVWCLLNFGRLDAYRSQFKSEVIQRLVQACNPDLDYRPNSGISQSEFSSSLIYRHRIDRYRCEDLIVGVIGETGFRFSEVHALYKTTSHSSKGTKTQWHTIFKGIFFIADFNKRFNGITLVLPDTMEGWGGFGQWLQEAGTALGMRQGELVKLEDPEFEQMFVVYSTDQVEARYILSTSLMERLVDFRNRTNPAIALSFVDSCVHIAIPSQVNHFEPPSLWAGSALLDLSDVQNYLADIQLAQAIIRDLNLNNRIWGK